MNVTIADKSKVGFQQLEGLIREGYDKANISWFTDFADMIHSFSVQKPDVVFLDSLLYPPQVVSEIRKKNPDVVVIAYASEGDLQAAHRMIKAGADDVIFKPIHRSTARTVLDRYYKLDK